MRLKTQVPADADGSARRGLTPNRPSRCTLSWSRVLLTGYDRRSILIALIALATSTIVARLTTIDFRGTGWRWTCRGEFFVTPQSLGKNSSLKCPYFWRCRISLKYRKASAVPKWAGSIQPFWHNTGMWQTRGQTQANHRAGNESLRQEALQMQRDRATRRKYEKSHLLKLAIRTLMTFKDIQCNHNFCC